MSSSHETYGKSHDGKSSLSRKSDEVKGEHDFLKKDKLSLMEHSHERMQSKKHGQEGWVVKQSRWSKDEKRDVSMASDKRSQHHHGESTRREMDERDRKKDAAGYSPERSKAHKRKRRSASTSSSASSFASPAPKSSKRHRHESPSPEPSRHYHAEKEYERGRSREKDSKKLHRVMHKVEKIPDAKSKHSRPSTSPQRIDVYVGDGRAKKQRSEDERSKSRHQNQAVVHKKSTHAREDSYAKEEFVRSSSRKIKPHIVEESVRDHLSKAEEKPSKKHKQQKKEKILLSSGDNEEIHLKGKKHRRSAAADSKSKKKIRDDARRNDRSSSYEASSSERETREPKKKARDIIRQSPAFRRSSSASPGLKKKYKDYEKYTSDQEGSQGETKKKAKWKKKKKKNADEYAIGFHKKSKEEILMGDTEESPRAKKTKKRKRAREETPSESSGSEEKPVKKSRHLESEVEWKAVDEAEKGRKRAKREYSPDRHRLEREVRARRSPTPPPPPAEKLLSRHLPHQQHGRRPDSPGSGSSRSERHSKHPISKPPPPLMKRTSGGSMDREHFKPVAHSSRERHRVVGGGEPPYNKPMVYRVDLDREDDRRMPPDMRPDRQMDKYAHEDRGRRPPDDFQRYPDKRTDRRFEHEPPPPRHEPPVIQRFEDKPPVRRMDRFPADERRRPDDRDFPPRDRPPSLERRVDHHVIRHDHGKPEWKPQRVDHRGGRGGEYRDVVDVRHSPNRGRRRSPPPVPGDRRLPPPPPAEYDERRHTQRISSWVDGRDGGKLRIETRERHFSKERWPADDRRPGLVEERAPDVRYKATSRRSVSRDRGHFPDKRGSPASFGTYREVRRSNAHHPRHELGLEVTIRDDGNRTSVDYDKGARKPHVSPARVVSSYDASRSRDRGPPPPQVSKMRRERDDSQSRRSEIMKPLHPRDRPEEGRYHPRPKENFPLRDISSERPRPRDFPPKPHDKPRSSSSYRPDSGKPLKREKLRTPGDFDRARASASRSSTRSPGRQRHFSPRSGLDKHARRPSKAGKGDKVDVDSKKSDRQKTSTEKKPSSSKSSKTKKVEETKAADVLEVDWSGISSLDGEKTEPKTEEASNSVLQKFTPGNVLLRMGVSSRLLPQSVLDKVVAKCKEASEDHPLVLYRGLGALNRREAIRRSAQMNIFSSPKTGVTSRLTSYTDARFRQRALGIDGDLRIPLIPPQVINAKTYSASIKHYLNKTKTAIEVQ